MDFRRADLIAPPFEAESFDHSLICFVLEHLSRPAEALVALKALLKPGETITVRRQASMTFGTIRLIAHRPLQREALHVFVSRR